MELTCLIGLWDSNTLRLGNETGLVPIAESTSGLDTEYLTNQLAKVVKSSNLLSLKLSVVRPVFGKQLLNSIAP